MNSWNVRGFSLLVAMAVMLCFSSMTAFAASSPVAPVSGNSIQSKGENTMSKKLDDAIAQVEGISGRVTALEDARAAGTAENDAKVDQLVESINTLDGRVKALEAPVAETVPASPSPEAPAEAAPGEQSPDFQVS